MSKKRPRSAAKTATATWPRGIKILGPVENYVPQTIEVVLGGQRVQVYKMTLGSLQTMIGLVEPYIKRIAQALLTQVGISGLGEAEAVKKALWSLVAEQISEMLVTVPGTLMQAVACIMNVPLTDEEQLQWFADEVLPEELLPALGALDTLNDFGALYHQATGVWTHFDDKYDLSSALSKELLDEMKGEEEDKSAE